MSNESTQETSGEVNTTPTEVVPTAAPKLKSISYSQYAMWLKCPHKWKLAYIDKLHKFDGSIHTAFGTALHHALQTYLKTLYTSTSVEADALDVMALFTEVYNKEITKVPGLLTEQIDEFRVDAKNILDYFTAPTNRQKHFPSRAYEVIGVELPINIPLRMGKVAYKGFLDFVVKEKRTGKIKIWDFKSSTQGWNSYQKVDRTKVDQLLLYKRFYNMTTSVPMDMIEVEFIILKRKLYENSNFVQQRIQRFSPPDGRMSMKAVEIDFLNFVKEGFDATGNYNTVSKFRKCPGKAKKNCKYCEFAKTMHCDSKEE